MNVTADTNILVRVVVEDDVAQAKAAQLLLKQATRIALTTPTLCELAWVLTRLYRVGKPDIAKAIRALIKGANVSIDTGAVQAGLDQLDAGGDFADGVIAYEGCALGGDEFVSFDKDAVSRLKKRGVSARLLA